MNTQITVCLVEDLDEIRNGVVELLQGSPDFLCLSAFADAETAMEELPVILPDIVIMDINLPGISGTEAIRKLSRQCPQIRFLMFTIYENSEQVYEALAAGASGYLLKKTPPEKILEALKELYEGGAPMSSRIARMVIDNFHVNPNSPLTKRETEILQLISEGKTYTQISEELFISKETAKTHIKNIYSKLQVKSKSEAIAKANMDKLI